MKLIVRWARQFGLARAVCTLLLLALVPLRLADPRPLEELRLRTFDLLQVLRPRQQTARPVVIADIDEASSKEIGQWPWPRTVVADLVSRLRELGAVAIGFDIVFAEPDRMSPALAAESFRGLDAATRDKLASAAEQRRRFGRCHQTCRSRGGRAGRRQRRRRRAREAETALQTGFAIRGPDPRPFLVTFPGLLRNVLPIEQAAAGRGLFSINPERDGIIRRVPVVMQAQETLVPSLTMEMLRVVTHAGAILIRTDEAGVQSVAVPGLELPTDRNGQFWVHFNKHDPARFVSATDVLHGRVAGRPFSRPAGADRHLRDRPPRHQDHAGRAGDARRRGPRPDSRERADQGASGTAQLRHRRRAGRRGGPRPRDHHRRADAAGLDRGRARRRADRRRSSACRGTSSSPTACSIDFTYPLISSWLIYLVLTFVNYFREQRQRQQIRSAFGFYLSPHMVEQLAGSPEKLVLGGEERRMTILFSDVRGFTTISEHYKDNPQGLTRLMNRFLTPMTNAIIERKGTIDKYIGDAIMAFWNAPLDDNDQEVNACDAALEMLARAEALNAEFKREAEENGGAYMPLRIGIGLNTGPCVVGNMGSDFRFNYSVLGDTVNVASRLEARTKDYRLPLVIGSRTAAGVKQKFATMEIDLIQVKGKKEPEAVYTVLGRAEVERDPRCRELRELNARMLACYRKQEWDEAQSLIVSCRKLANGFDVAGLYDMYAGRIEAYRAHPLPPDWNGVYEAESK